MTHIAISPVFGVRATCAGCTASPKQPIAQDPVGAPRLELFFDGLLQDLHPEHGIGIHLLELGVFL
ncbi:MAG: hypothetical protein ACON38_07675, partial [Akkermansiaceae bacterium]